MNSVDWVAVPSYWPENAPVVITEALAAGIPVIVASLGGKQELVDFELNAIKVDGDLEIDWVEAFARTQGVDSNLLWTRLSENCRNKNDFDTALKLTKKLYQSAIKNSLVKFEV
jgi:glycosyltransferase involved in cell wall biosynthesis